MKFKSILNQYINQLGCTAKELSNASGLSASVLSRYRSGERIPKQNDELLSKLAKAISSIAHNKGLLELTYDIILTNLKDALKPDFDAEVFSKKFDFLITKLNINVSHMANHMGYDASFISRIRTGKRVPGDTQDFIQKVSLYIIKNCNKQVTQETLCNILELDITSISDTRIFIEHIQNWLSDNSFKSENHIFNFIQKLDEFNLDDYIHAIHFDELKVPSIPFQLPTTKEYFGIEGQQKCELNFLKGTVLSKSNEPVFMCGDMDMADIAKDSDFPKKWMFGLAMILKRNLDIHMIHNLNRPFYELMLGLEAWIPLYMTGQVVPFYLKGNNNNIYQHMLYVSGTFALSGECIKGFHNDGKWYLTNNKDEVAYYKKRAECLKKKAFPLMDIYTVDKSTQFDIFNNASTLEKGAYHYIASSLPLFTLDDELLINILHKNNVSDTDTEKLLTFVKTQREKYAHLLIDSTLLYEIPEVSKEDFDKYPFALDFTDCFFPKTILCDYEDYMLHLNKTKEYVLSHPNLKLHKNISTAFHNIQIRILEGKWVWISKVKSPAIHFVIYQSQLREAIENMYIPMFD